MNGLKTDNESLPANAHVEVVAHAPNHSWQRHEQVHQSSENKITPILTK